MKQPSAQTAINILSGLLESSNPADLAYWVAPNTVLTLSGARAYCDGGFFHPDRQVLKSWLSEINSSLKKLKSITAVYSAETAIGHSPMQGSYASYDLVFSQGLIYTLDHSSLLIDKKPALLKQHLTSEKLLKAISTLLAKQARFSKLGSEYINDIALGIILGYPDEAILESVAIWDKNDPIAEKQLMHANIEYADYYDCPQPVYDYPKHLVTSIKIKAHERMWSSILKNFYNSSFHLSLAKNSEFNAKAKMIGLLS